MDTEISASRLEEARQEFARHGVSIRQWAHIHGFPAQLVYQVLAGRKRCLRGKSHAIAVRLGLKPGVIGSVADIDAVNRQASQRIETAEDAMR
ncbi:DNA-binding protein [Thermomonas sp. HDW16]|uniref:DNA-binding protein n=1 Tax=Thermomonas sp. HDW16 TaxID=2714945 RepID=UPI00140C3E6F|nr:DNA-binding protein [Thermomonas sp. HDW16]QIL19762.1 DNA-binding protein [Thermomonas sp. HDW16]